MIHEAGHVKKRHRHGTRISLCCRNLWALPARQKSGSCARFSYHVQDLLLLSVVVVNVGKLCDGTESHSRVCLLVHRGFTGERARVSKRGLGLAGVLL